MKEKKKETQKFNVIVSSSPHIRDPLTTHTIMRLVFIALLPAAIWGVYEFGLYAGLILVTSIVTAILSEYLFEILTKREITISDGSAALTGLLFGMVISPTTPLWMVVIGSSSAIIIAKQFFGGLGSNFLNPALFGRAVVFLSWTGLLNRWLKPGFNFFYFLSGSQNLVTTATPLDLFRLHQLNITPSLYSDLFFGRVGGSIGETSKLLLLIGVVFLLLIRRDIIDIKIPLTFVGTVALLAFLFRQDVLFHLLSGGLIIGAFFMATDYVTTPVTPLGRVIFGIGAGVVTFVIRNWGIYPEGVSFGILSMNVLTPLFDKFLPRVFGTGGKK